MPSRSPSWLPKVDLLVQESVVDLPAVPSEDPISRGEYEVTATEPLAEPKYEMEVRRAAPHKMVDEKVVPGGTAEPPQREFEIEEHPETMELAATPKHTTGAFPQRAAPQETVRRRVAPSRTAILPKRDFEHPDAELVTAPKHTVGAQEGRAASHETVQDKVASGRVVRPLQADFNIKDHVGDHLAPTRNQVEKLAPPSGKASVKSQTASPASPAMEFLESPGPYGAGLARHYGAELAAQARTEAGATLKSVFAEIARRQQELELRYQMELQAKPGKQSLDMHSEGRSRVQGGRDNDVRLNIGSIIVQVESQPAANAPNRPATRLSRPARDTGNRWVRSFLDR